MKVMVSNGYITRTFESEESAIKFFGLEEYEAIRDGIHSQYTLRYIR